MLVDRYIEHLAHERRASHHTVNAYRADLGLLGAYLAEQGVGAVEEADAALLRYWMMARLEGGDSARTVNRRLSSIRGFFRFALMVGACKVDPTRLLEAPKMPQRLPEFVEERRMEELFALRGAATGPDAELELLVIELLYGTGMRLAELLGLKVGDLEADRATLRLLGKRNKERIVPIAEGLVARLQRHLAERSPQGLPSDAPLLAGRSGEPLSRSRVQRLVRRYLGLVTTQRKRSPHVLRHTFATHMLDHGADLNAVKELLGHAGLAATQVYTHNTAEKLKKAHAQAHPRGGRRGRNT